MVLAQAVVGGKKMIDSPQLVSDIVLVIIAPKKKGYVYSVAEGHES